MDLDIQIIRTKSPKEKPQSEANLSFGKLFTDHMFLVEYTEGRGWHDARIQPYGPLAIDPASTPLPSRLSCPFLGLMWHALPSATSPQPNSFDPGMPNSSINRDWQSTDEFPV